MGGRRPVDQLLFLLSVRMAMMKRRVGFGLVFALALIASGCGATTINKVLADPGKYPQQSGNGWRHRRRERFGSRPRGLPDHGW